MLLAGCNTDHGLQLPNPVAQSQLVTRSDNASERQRLIAVFGGEYEAPRPVVALITDVANRVIAASDDPATRYRVTLLNSSTVNAFALPSGDLYLTRGLIALANDTSELAAVIAHEVAHVTARHAMQRAEWERQVAATFPSIVSDVDGPAASQTRFALASFSRTQELEADEIGIRTMAKAGYDPYGAARFLNSLARQSNLRATLLGEMRRQARFNFLSTHPSTPQRLAVALDVARLYVGPDATEADRARYLSALDGLAYGDDPSGGIVRGRRFFHPKLDFTFTAPEDFALENSPQAVVGLSPDGGEALRLDSVRLSGTAEASLAAGWIEGTEVQAIETLTINGLPAAIAVATGPEWSFRLAAIQKDSNMFRIIFATRKLTTATDLAFRRSIESFRPLLPDETAGLHALKLATVPAEPGDNAEQIASLMSGIDRPVERFLALNGLDRLRLRPGELYKIVVDQ